MSRHAARGGVTSSIGIVGALLLSACGDGEPPLDRSAADPAAVAAELGLSDAEVRKILRLSPLGAVPADPTNRVADDPRAAWLGQSLFFDARLSGNGQVSCATCHDPAKEFADGREVALGIAEGTRNTPTVLDAARSRWLTWDGRADSLWSQALQPIERPHEMDGTRVGVARVLAGDPALSAAYEEVFGPLPDANVIASLPARARPVPGDPTHPDAVAWESIDPPLRHEVEVVFANAGKSLAAYQRRLRAGEGAFDRFARGLREGDREGIDAIPPEAIAGARLFVGRAGCIQCHGGPTFSDGEFHSIGMPPRGGGLPRDPGRYLGTEILLADRFNAAGEFSDDRLGAEATMTARVARSPEQWGQFRTPGLRQVARTAPYMHAGQLPDLESVVRFYSTLEGAVQLDHHQETVLAPLGLGEEEIRALVAFLETLAGPGPEEGLSGPPRHAMPDAADGSASGPRG